MEVQWQWLGSREKRAPILEKKRRRLAERSGPREKRWLTEELLELRLKRKEARRRDKQGGKVRFESAQSRVAMPEEEGDSLGRAEAREVNSLTKELAA